MYSKNKLQIPYWIARAWSVIALLFLIIFVGAHFVEIMEAGRSISGELSKDELASFIFFPAGMMVSLAVVQFKYRLGGYLCILCMLGFLITRPDMVTSPMIYFFGFPGVLFLIYSYLRPENEVSYN